MTFKNFTKLYEANRVVKYEDLKSTKLGIDAYVEIFRTSGVGYISGLTNSEGETTQHIKATLNNILKAISLNIYTIWCFDGKKHTIEKSNTQNDRKTIRERNLKELEDKKNKFDKLKKLLNSMSLEERKETIPDYKENLQDMEAEIKKLECRNPTGNQFGKMKKDIIFMLDCLGIDYTIAPDNVEAEELAASMSRSGEIDGFITTDPDYLLYGGTKMYKKIPKQTGKYSEYELSTILEDNKIDMETFIQTGIALGTDFASKVPRVGPKTVLKKINDNKIQWSDEQKQAMDVFTKNIDREIPHEIIHKERTSESIDKLLNWLVDVQSFNRETLEKKFNNIFN
jgi:5'-3' exonuclease